jgi:hypothetical protein
LAVVATVALPPLERAAMVVTPASAHCASGRVRPGQLVFPAILRFSVVREVYLGPAIIQYRAKTASPR